MKERNSMRDRNSLRHRNSKIKIQREYKRKYVRQKHRETKPFYIIDGDRVIKEKTEDRDGDSK